MAPYVVDIREPTTRLLYTTVRLELVYPDGSLGSGTGSWFEESSPNGRVVVQRVPTRSGERLAVDPMVHLGQVIEAREVLALAREVRKRTP
jgi:hypothetical protein